MNFLRASDAKVYEQRDLRSVRQGRMCAEIIQVTRVRAPVSCNIVKKEEGGGQKVYF